MTDALATEPPGVDRSLTSYGDEGFSRFLRRAFLASLGLDDTDLERPVIGVAHTISDYTTCHREMPQLVEAVKRGVLEAGGLPLAFPTMSLPEILMSPTSMLYRNLAAMETEELLRSQPMDGVVLVGGCDKTVPAHVLGAISAGVPAVSLVAGPMSVGAWHGERLGACTDCRRLWASHRAGLLDGHAITDARQQLAPTGGTCMVMGTASTMAFLVEALGLAPIGSATAPAPTGDRLRNGVAAGRLAVAAAQARRTPASLLSAESIENALTVLVGIGGSTNAVVHLAAIARRAGLPFSLHQLAEVSARTPLLVDCKPAASGYVPDVHAAGGSAVVLKALEPLLQLDAGTITGRTLGEELAAVAGPPAWQRVVRTLDDPVGPVGGLAVLHGSLAPGGAVLKRSAAGDGLLRHRGPAVVFESPADLAARIDDESLGITADHVIVLRNAGPRAAGMPEAGSAPIPRHLAAAGVTDMVRVSDARMSGTAYGTVVLHVTPEAAASGPLALVRDGDLIELDVEGGRIDLLVDDAELSRRRAGWAPPPAPPRGWARLYATQVLSGTDGADLDLLGPAGPDALS